MQQRRILSEKQINAELLNGNLATPKWYFPVMGVLGIGVVIGFITILYMFNRGLGVTGLAGPVYWGLFITIPLPFDRIAHSPNLSPPGTQ